MKNYGFIKLDPYQTTGFKTGLWKLCFNNMDIFNIYYYIEGSFDVGDEVITCMDDDAVYEVEVNTSEANDVNIEMLQGTFYFSIRIIKQSILIFTDKQTDQKLRRLLILKAVT